MGLPKRLPTSLALAVTLTLGAQSLAFAQAEDVQGPPSIVATTEVLGSIVSEVVGDAADVTTLMGSGADPHSWAPSARDVERIMEATLVVENGFALEDGLLEVLGQARAEGIPVFTASDHVVGRLMGDGHDHEHADGVHTEGEVHHGHGGTAHACGHFDDDPVEVASDGAVPDDHTRYAISLADGAAAVSLQRDEAGAVSIFLGSDVPLSLTDEAGEALATEETMAVGDECPAIATVTTFDLAAGAYALALGPATDVSAVDLVWEVASHEADHEHEADHAEGDHDDGHHHAADAEDPHIWLDPMGMRAVVEAMVPALDELGIDVSEQAVAYIAELDALDAEITDLMATIPEERRQVVADHIALGYFGDRYGLEQIGAVLPSVSTAGEPSAQDVAALISTMEEAGVSVVFTSIGTPQDIAEAVADAVGGEVVRLSMAHLPADGSYVSLIRDIAQAIAGALGDQ